MADPAKVPDSLLEYGRDTGAVMYLTAYVRLMCRAIGVDDTNVDAVQAMVVQMVEPLSKATEATWRAMMADDEWTEIVEQFKHRLQEL